MRTSYFLAIEIDPEGLDNDQDLHQAFGTNQKYTLELLRKTAHMWQHPLTSTVHGELYKPNANSVESVLKTSDKWQHPQASIMHVELNPIQIQ